MRSLIKRSNIGAKKVPEGLWVKCPACDAVLYRAELERNLQVCPKCSHHMRIEGRDRLLGFLDEGTGRELADEVEPEDPLKFRDSKKYRDRLTVAQKTVGEKDAMIVMAGALQAIDVVACAFEFRFLGGSMGSVVGERFTRGAEHCLANGLPLICFSSSGGARMQEGLLSLLQMSKTSAVLSRMAQAKLPYISVLTDPTTGGVSASGELLASAVTAHLEAMSVAWSHRRIDLRCAPGGPLAGVVGAALIGWEDQAVPERAAADVAAPNPSRQNVTMSSATASAARPPLQP